jgi:glycosyltransferase involved in cell wall biosynthesis
VTLSVVVCTRNRPAELADCLASLADQERRPDEVVVVDASDTDRPRRTVETWSAAVSGVSVRFLHTVPGLTRQRNLGVDAATGDVLTFLDDDVVLAPGYLAAIGDLFADPAIGGAEGTVETVLPTGRRWVANAFRRLFLMNSLGRPRRVKRSGFAAYDPAPASVRPVGCLSGCNMSYRRTVFGRFRFDEWYDGYGLGEDKDFSYRVGRVHRLVQTPHARLQHRLSPVGRERRPAFHEMSVVHHWYFVRKNLPATATTWLCFLWSELGELIAVAKTGERGAVTGRLRGYARLVRAPGRAAPAVPREASS